MTSVLEQAMEQRRRQGDVWPRTHSKSEVEAMRGTEAETVLAAIDDLEPQVLALAEEAWGLTVRLRHAAARLTAAEGSPIQLAAAIVEARRAFEAATNLVGPGVSDSPPEPE
jgi:hypothetical protein